MVGQILSVYIEPANNERPGRTTLWPGLVSTLFAPGKGMEPTLGLADPTPPSSSLVLARRNPRRTRLTPDAGVAIIVERIELEKGTALPHHVSFYLGDTSTRRGLRPPQPGDPYIHSARQAHHRSRIVPGAPTLASMHHLHVVKLAYRLCTAVTAGYDTQGRWPLA